MALKCREKMYENDHALHALGIEVKINEIGSAEAVMEVRPDMMNGHDICHGGFIFTLADTAFGLRMQLAQHHHSGCGRQYRFSAAGSLWGQAHSDSQKNDIGGQRLGLYDIEVRNQDGELLAILSGRSRSTRQSLLSESDT